MCLVIGDRWRGPSSLSGHLLDLGAIEEEIARGYPNPGSGKNHYQIPDDLRLDGSEVEQEARGNRASGPR